MNITSVITKTYGTGSIKATADVTLEGLFTIRDVLLLEGKNGVFVRMPCHKWADETGQFRYSELIRPASQELREEILSSVLGQYQERIEEPAIREVPLSMS
ncbi:MAG: SpoVG family protein [Clostridia bacterium]|nr:SpoVG family protein [Clostridia bacterium]